MTRPSRKYRVYIIVIVTAFLLSAFPAFVRAEEGIVASLSSELGPYREAFEGFQEALGHSVPSFNLQKEGFQVSYDMQVVVAFGGKAAHLGYPDSVVLIYCMAPGTRLGLRDRKGSSVEVEMLPQPLSILSILKEIQPSLKQLAVFWSSQSMEDYFREIEKASKSVGIHILSGKLNKPDELPARLRDLFGKTEAIWLLPDPSLVNTKSFSIFKEYSWSNKIPLYAPSAGFVEQGATASVSSSFREIGIAAAAVAREVLSGNPVEEIVYPARTEITLSVKAAENTGIKISPEFLRKLNKVVP